MVQACPNIGRGVLYNMGAVLAREWLVIRVTRVLGYTDGWMKREVEALAQSSLSETDGKTSVTGAARGYAANEIGDYHGYVQHDRCA